MAVGIPVVATVTLTNAQIRALPTTGIQVVAAPGAGKMIAPVSGIVVIDSTAGIYTTDDGARWQLLLGSQEWSGLMQPNFGLRNAGINAMPIPPYVGIGTTDDLGYLTATVKSKAAVENQPLNIKDDFNGVADYTGGNAANTVSVSVLYHVVTI